LAGEASEEEVETMSGSLLPVGPCRASITSLSANPSSTLPSFWSVLWGMKAIGGSRSFPAFSAGASPSCALQSFPYCCSVHISDVLEAWDSRPVSGEDSSPIGVCLALEDDSRTSSLESEVESSDAAEE
jgi:hypothetical protein